MNLLFHLVLIFLAFFTLESCQTFDLSRSPSSLESAGVHGLAMHGDLKYGRDFQHFDYVNPNASKGGTVHLAAIGTFNTMNPFTLKGNPADSIGLIYETLTTGSLDEPFSEYGLLAKSIKVADDRSLFASILATMKIKNFLLLWASYQCFQVIIGKIGILWLRLLIFPWGAVLTRSSG